MSDRARSSVRTGSRSGPDGADGVPESAAPAGAGRPSDDVAPAGGATAVTSAGSGRPGSGDTTSIRPDVTVDRGVPAVHPATPLVPPGTSAGRAPAGRAVATEDRPGPDATQSVPFAAGGNRPVTAGPTGAPVPGPAGEAARGSRSGRGAGRGPRRARLQLRHVDIWSAFKISLVVSLALFFVWMIAVGVLYLVLNQLGVFSTVNDLIGQLGTASGKTGSGDVVHASIVFGAAAVIGLVNVVLMTALATVAAFVYNLCADLVGGLEVTLAERD